MILVIVSARTVPFCTCTYKVPNTINGLSTVIPRPTFWGTLDKEIKESLQQRWLRVAGTLCLRAPVPPHQDISEVLKALGVEDEEGRPKARGCGMCLASMSFLLMLHFFLMYVHVCVCVYIHMYTYTCNICLHVCIYIETYIHIYVCISLCVCVYR